MVANLARSQLLRKHVCFPVFVRACEFDLTRHVWSPRPVPSSPFSKPRPNLVLTRGLLSFLPRSATASIHIVNCHRANPKFTRSHNGLRTDGVYYRESVGTGPVVLKVVHVLMSAAYSSLNSMDQIIGGGCEIRVLFLHPHPIYPRLPRRCDRYRDRQKYPVLPFPLRHRLITGTGFKLEEMSTPMLVFWAQEATFASAPAGTHSKMLCPY